MILRGNQKEFLLKEEETKSEELRGSKAVVRIRLAGIEVEALADSGSEVTCVSEELWSRIKQGHELPTLPLSGVTVRGALKGCRSKRVKQQTLIDIQFGRSKKTIVCLIVPDLARDVILGDDFMHEAGAILSYKARALILDWDGVTEILPWVTTAPSVGITVEILEEVHPDSSVQEEEEDKEAVIDQIVRLIPDLEDIQREALARVLKTHKEVFTERPGRVKGYEIKLEVNDETPFCVRPYPIPFAKREATDRQIQKMENWGIIRRDTTPYINPISVQYKKNGDVRICLDARRLNARLTQDMESPPPPESLLQRFIGMKFFSTLDMTASYWQFALTKESQKYTGFLYNNRSYVFQVMPFGISTAVGQFCRGLDITLGPEIREFLTSYVDDKLLASETFEKHLEYLDQLLTKLKEVGFTLNLEKCEFLKKEVKFLGFFIGGEGVRVDPEKLKPIQDFPTPTSSKMLRRFLGMCVFYTRFREKAAVLTQPLNAVLKKGNWKWTEVEAKAFQEVKESFLKCIILTHPDPTKTYYLQTDGSDIGLGAELYQLDEEGERRTIAFYSRVLHAAELNYTTTEKELLAIVAALEKWRMFVLGTKLIIVTDHIALTFLQRCKLRNNRLSRWVLAMQEYQFTVEHCKGKDNIVSDTLSRYPPGAKTYDTSVNATEYEVLHLDPQERRKVARRIENIQQLQEADPRTEELRRRVLSNPVKVSFVLKNGVLYKIDRRTGRHLLEIPTSLQEDLVFAHHEETGHLGSQKLTVLMRLRYHWPKMKKTIRLQIRSCDLCQKSKVPTQRIEGISAPIIPPGPGELLAVDLFGPAPKSTRGAILIFAVLDVFSKYVKFYPLKKATSRTCFMRLKDFVTELRIQPQRILSDQGTQFTSHLWKKKVEEMGAKPIWCSVENPQGNPVERVMRELNRLLRCYCHTDHSSWAKWIPEINKWINQAVHESTGCPPQELMLQQPVVLTFDDLLPLFKPVLDTGQQVDQARFTLWRKAAARGARREKSKTLSLTEGQPVLLRSQQETCTREGLYSKFFLLYAGPYIVERVIGPNVYLIRDDEGNQIGTFNIRHLKPYHVAGISTDASCRVDNGEETSPSTEGEEQSPPARKSDREGSADGAPSSTLLQRSPGALLRETCAPGDPVQSGDPADPATHDGSLPAAKSSSMAPGQTSVGDGQDVCGNPSSAASTGSALGSLAPAHTTDAGAGQDVCGDSSSAASTSSALGSLAPAHTTDTGAGPDVDSGSDSAAPTAASSLPGEPSERS